MLVRDLLSLPGLRLSLAAGARGLDNAIRFAHTSELEDPTPWLSGGELLLTTGMGLGGSATSQRTYVRRLARARLAGLGLGVGFGFEDVPTPVRAAAEVEGFPVLEVPYPVPFIAITEAISARLTHDAIKDAQASVESHERLTAIIAEGGGTAEVLDVLAALAGGWALLFDPAGEPLALSSATGLPSPAEVWEGLPPGLLGRAGPATAADVSPHGTRLALAVVAGGRPEAVLVFGKDRRLEQRDRLAVRHAVTVLGLLLSSRRAVIEAERRMAGDVLSEALGGRLAGTDLEHRLELAGFARGAGLTALVLEVGERLPIALQERAWEVDAALGHRCAGARTTVLEDRVVALVAHESPESLARVLVAGPPGDPPGSGPVASRVGVGTTVPARSVRDSFLAATFALRAAPAAVIASPNDLGSYGLLLGAQPRSLLESYVGSVLGPLLARDRRRSSDLVASVRAFVDAGGRWERGAEALGIHRHTLRYRIRQAEEVLGRDLASAEDRLEVWLALKALDVLAT